MTFPKGALLLSGKKGPDGASDEPASAYFESRAALHDDGSAVVSDPRCAH